jgi:hypothetical protein
MLLVGLAPLLSYADAVDGAPAGALKAGLAIPHRRGLIDAPDSPWHRRYAGSRRQVSDPMVDGERSLSNFSCLLFLLCASLSKLCQPQLPLGPFAVPHAAAMTSDSHETNVRYLLAFLKTGRQTGCPRPCLSECGSLTPWLVSQNWQTHSLRP